MAMGSLIPVVMTTMVFTSLVLTVITEDVGGCNCRQFNDTTIRCIGISRIPTSLNATTQTLEIDCINRSKILELKQESIPENNQLTTLSIRNCGLERIGDYAFDKMDSLTTIELKGNSLSNVHVDAFIVSGGKPDVLSLDLSYNNLETLPPVMFNFMGRAKYVNLRHNRISDLSDGLFTNLQAVVELDLGENRLRDISDGTFRLQTAVTHLHLDSNQLESVSGMIFPVTEDSTLTMLNLSGNVIAQLFSLCQRLGRLEYMYLARNKLSSFDAGMLNGCSSLQTLDLQYNLIREIATGAFQGMPVLRELRLQGNNLIELADMTFSNLFSLERLELQHNNIVDMEGEPFHNMTSLIYLNLSGNSIQVLNSGVFAGLTSMLHLDVGKNEISRVKAMVFAGSFADGDSSLNMSGNVLSSIDSMSFANVSLTELKMDNCPNMSVIPVGAFANSKVRILNISGCDLEAIDFLQPIDMELHTLDVSHQHQKLKIPDKTFADSVLTELILEGNNLHAVDFLSWTAAGHLNLGNTNIKTLLPTLVMESDSADYRTTTLSLWGNDFESIEEISHLLPDSGLQELDLSRNRLLVLGPLANETLVLKDMRFFILNENMAAQPVMIKENFFPTDMQKISFVGTKVSGLKNIEDVDELLLDYVDFQADAQMGPRVCAGRVLSMTHASLTLVPYLATECKWQEINLSHNKLTKIRQGDISYVMLQKLDFSYNNIYVIEGGAFENINLDEVNLSNNDLTSLNDLLLWFGNALPTDVKVDFSNNRLQTLPMQLNDELFSTAEVNVDSNPLHCNCDMYWATDYVCKLQHRNNGHELTKRHCETPRKISFSELIPSDIPYGCVAPHVNETQSEEIREGISILSCVATGDPLPMVYWFGVDTNSQRVHLSTTWPPEDKAASHTAASVIVDEAGTVFERYECVANTSRNSSSVFQDKPPMTRGTTTGISPVIAAASSSSGDPNSKYTAGEMAGAIVGALLICLLCVALVLLFIWKLGNDSTKYDITRQPSLRDQEGVEHNNLYRDVRNRSRPASFLNDVMHRLSPRRLFRSDSSREASVYSAEANAPPHLPHPRDSRGTETLPLDGNLRTSSSPAGNATDEVIGLYEDTDVPLDDPRVSNLHEDIIYHENEVGGSTVDDNYLDVAAEIDRRGAAGRPAPSDTLDISDGTAARGSLLKKSNDHPGTDKPKIDEAAALYVNNDDQYKVETQARESIYLEPMHGEGVVDIKPTDATEAAREEQVQCNSDTHPELEPEEGLYVEPIPPGEVVQRDHPNRMPQSQIYSNDDAEDEYLTPSRSGPGDRGGHSTGSDGEKQEEIYENDLAAHTSSPGNGTVTGSDGEEPEDIYENDDVQSSTAGYQRRSLPTIPERTYPRESPPLYVSSDDEDIYETYENMRVNR